jgi:peptide/nickel transport system substrate-binding protein
MKPRTIITKLAAVCARRSVVAGAAFAQTTLRIGLAEDPDILDPTLARTFVGRIVFAGLCDKLFDLDEKLNIVPQLATGFQWSPDYKALTLKLRPGVTFHDGEKLDATAVKFNIERHKTLAGSNRRGELAPVASVDVVDESTVRLNLSSPFSPLVSMLTDRAGMMVSPKAAQAAWRQLRREAGLLGTVPLRRARSRRTRSSSSAIRTTGTRPRSVSTASSICRSSIRPVRLANLKSGQLDFIERVGTSDMAALKNDKRFKDQKIVEIGYQGLTINTGKSEQAQKNPLGKDPAGARSARAGDRSRGNRPGGDGWRGAAGQPVGRADESVLRQVGADAEAQRRARQAVAEGRRACRIPR